MKVLQSSFFDRPTLRVAKDFLGKFLIRKNGRKKISGMITEVEAYIGRKDKASHASRGRTKRTEIMFGEAGFWYVYLIYGMHHCLNIVTEKKGYPAAILIRGVRLLDGTEIKGPGRVCKYFAIDKGFNTKKAIAKTGLWVADDGVKTVRNKIKKGKRIGVDYAGKWKDRLWRFSI